MTPPKKVTLLPCACGRVVLETTGAPLLTACCYCDDCQEGARRIEALPGAPAVLTADGGTELVLYRKDRVRCARGAELLRPLKLQEQSVTNRFVATCCDTAMYLGFDKGPHWVSVYRTRFADAAPPIQLRVQTKFRPANSPLPDSVPTYPGYPLRFMVKLVGARLAMWLGR
ncbi:DUF6151 family protein [Comamonas sp. JC664]|uniref:GFA family protein n=1 Tax=Comamonas sp. JC664 TaxID=2801917 RepID=UPI001749BD0C|nr:DUF6151 family protein [Comamonas sp. JC664]MBL0692244.1 hypothetical protein [Comamonas sp. JC664]